MERTEAEYAEREKLIAKIEGFTGTLNSMTWSTVKTEDLIKILDAIETNWSKNLLQW